MNELISATFWISFWALLCGEGIWHSLKREQKDRLIEAFTQRLSGKLSSGRELELENKILALQTELEETKRKSELEKDQLRQEVLLIEEEKAFMKELQK